MTLDDLKKIFLGPLLFRLDSIVAPKVVPVLYFAGLAGILLWAVSHLFWTFGFGFGNGLWGLLEIVVFGLLMVLVLRVSCEAALVFFKANELATIAAERERAQVSLLDEVRDAIHDLADDDEDDEIIDATVPPPVIDAETTPSEPSVTPSRRAPRRTTPKA